MKYNQLNYENMAFLIGNGINRYPNNPKDRSWEYLLTKIFKDKTNDSMTEIPKGIQLTEFYEILLLQIYKKTLTRRLSNSGIEDLFI